MYIEFFIAGLTGFFLWLFLRQLTEFQQEKTRQRAGELLEEVHLPLKIAILRLAMPTLFLLLFCGYVAFFDYMMIISKFTFPDTIHIHFSLGSLSPDMYVFLDLQCLAAAFILLPLGTLCFRSGRKSFLSRWKLSFAIHERGILYKFNINGNLALISWKKIEYLIWSPTKRKFYLQRKGHFSFFRRSFAVEKGKDVLKDLGEFVEIRDREGKILAAPLQPPEILEEERILEKSRWGFLRFQFDLRSLLLLMLVVASVASWYAYRQHRLQPTKAALALLAEFRPMVAYRDVDVQYLLFWGNGKKPGDKDLIVLRSFPNLEALGFSSDPAITDAGLAEMEPLFRLKTLELMGTSITDAGLLHLRNLTELRELNLLATGITDVGLANLKPLNQLQFLRLSATKVTDAGLVHLQSFPQLEVLELSGLGITDEGLRHLALLKNLRKLDLTRSKVTDVGLAHLKPLSQLQVLNLVGTQISDAGLPNLYGLKNLKSVELSSTQVTPAGLALLKQALREDATIDFTPPTPPLPPTPMDETPEETEPSTVNDSAENHNSVMRYLLVAIVLLLDKME